MSQREDEEEVRACNLVAALERRAASQAERVGFEFLDLHGAVETRLTYGELNSGARACAAMLFRRGLAGKRLILCCQDNREFVLNFYGILLAGGTVVPVNPRLIRTPEPWLRLLAVAAPAAVLTDIADSSVAAGANVPIIAIDPHLPPAPADLSLPMGAPHSPAVIQFTSGSTGQPRGVVVTHANFISNAGSIGRAMNMGEGDTGVVWLPFFHDMGLMSGAILPVMAGYRAVLIRPASFAHSPSIWLRALSGFRATLTVAPNFAYQLCVDRVSPSETENAALDLSSLRVAILGAEPVAAGTIDAFSRRFSAAGFARGAFRPSYGLAEATLFVSGERDAALEPRIVECDRNALDAEGRFEPASAGRVSKRIVSCGRPAPELDVAIVDPDQHRPRADGEVGEIWILGPSVSPGYDQAPEDNAQTFGALLADGRGPYLRTGDLGFRLEGELFVTGRIKDLIIVRGANHYPQDLEESARDASEWLRLGGSAAFTSDDRLVIIQETSARKVEDVESIFAAVRRRLAEAHGLTIGEIVLIRSRTLPRTSSGKVQRRRTRELWREGQLAELAKWTAPSNEPTVRSDAPAPSIKAAVQAALAEILGRDVGSEDNFFDLGADSVALARFHVRLTERLCPGLNLLDIVSHPNVAALAGFIEGRLSGSAVGNRPVPALGTVANGRDIAIIGMAGRFPEATSLQQFWNNLLEGRESIREIDKQTLLASGVPASQLRHPDYVRAASVIEGADLFAAGFFNFAPAEAASMDPQQRVLLEVAFDALQDANHVANDRASTGVFVGSGLNSRRLPLLDPALAYSEPAERWYTILGNDKDFLAARLSYKLKLNGPSITVQTACSTSLVAVHLACQSLLSGESDVALAGGVSVASSLAPQGYLYREGDVASPDGHCRPFDSAGKGTIFGDGAGIVVLKRLADAVRDGDNVRAVIRGSAVNCDGADKLGFAAPSIAGQSEVIGRALALASIDPRSISCLEAHGTATQLGDPIEVAALTRAFRRYTEDRGFCALASVKANIGHLGAAAGVAGLIKTVLALEGEQLPPAINFETPNPLLDLETTPFRVETSATAWPRTETPRRAGVSSFGIGGSNAHLVVEEAPLRPPPGSRSSHEIVLLSGEDAATLDGCSSDWNAFLADREDAELGDVAFASAIGRQHLRMGRAVVCRTARDGAAALASRDPRSVISGERRDSGASILFMLPGFGTQRAGMGKGLYDEAPIFRRELETCIDLFQPELDIDLRAVMLGEFRRDAAAADQMSRSTIGQASQFALSYALARQWQEWGVEPGKMIGYSLGEIVAATLAGVFRLEDAIRAVAKRAALMESTGSGAMLVVLASEEEARPLVDESGASLACFNAPEALVAAGAEAQIAALEDMLGARGVTTRRLRADRAYHSPAMDPAVGPYVEFLGGLDLRPPRIPFISNVSGDWIEPAEATDPAYWGRHLRQPVRFGAGIRTAVAGEMPVMLEVGAGAGLSLLAEQQLADRHALIVPSLPQPDGGLAEYAGLLQAVGKLWCSGHPVDWHRFYRGRQNRKMPLPPHRLRRERYRIAADDGGLPGRGDDVIVESSEWQRAPWPRGESDMRSGSSSWLLVGGGGGLRNAIGERLRGRNIRPVLIDPSRQFERAADHYALDLDGQEQVTQLMTELVMLGQPVAGIVDLRALAPVTVDGTIPGPGDLQTLLDGYAVAAGESISRLVSLRIEQEDVTGLEASPRSGVAHERVKAPSSLLVIDLARADLDPDVIPRTAGHILVELEVASSERVVCHRGAARWLLRRRRLMEGLAQDGALRDGAIHLVTLDDQGLGLAVAAEIAARSSARFVFLVAAGALPEAARLIGAARGAQPGLGDAVVIDMPAPSDTGALANLPDRIREAVGGEVTSILHMAIGDPVATETRCREAEILCSVFGPSSLDFIAFALLEQDSDQSGEVASLRAVRRHTARLRGAGARAQMFRLRWAGGDIGGRDRLAVAMVDALQRAETELIIRPARPEPEAAVRTEEGDGLAQPQMAHPTLFSRPDLAVAYAPPGTVLEKAIADIWRRNLNLDKVGVHDNFFELGGHSLLAGRMAMQLARALDRSFPVTELFRFPTIAGIAGYIEGAGASPDAVPSTAIPEPAVPRAGRSADRARRRIEARAGARVQDGSRDE